MSLSSGKGVGGFSLAGNSLGEAACVALKTALIKAWKADKRVAKVYVRSVNICTNIFCTYIHT